MSGHAAAQPVTGDEALSEKSEKSYLPAFDIPNRTTSQQPSSIPQPPPKPESPDEPPSPRRGSKRSLINRSRQGSRSSRRSARHAAKALESREPVPPLPSTTQTVRPERKQKSGGFLSFLNCCRADEDADTLKEEEPDLPPKQRRIEATPQRAAVPDESADQTPAEKIKQQEPQHNEKTEEPVTLADEKPAVPEKPQDSSRSRLNRSDPYDRGATGVAAIPVPTALASETGQPEPPVQAGSSRQQMPPTDQPVDVEPSAAAQKAPLDFPPPPREDQTVNDVEMPDAPIVPPVQDQQRIDEPTQPGDVAPAVLPPPPPLEKRIAQTQPPEAVPPVPDADPASKQQWLLPPVQPHLKGRKCLILDLDETLVHSSFKILNQADFTIPVEIEGQYHNVYVIKRPGVDQFMKRVGELYEVVVFTASVSKYGDPLLDQLDIHHVVHHRLFRESCYNHQGNYVKDLSQVGRDLKETIIIDNSPTSYIFHPQHAVPISSWFSDAHDNELLDLIPVLEDLAGSQVQDVSLVLDVAL